jgi:hypothetical protein
MVIIETWILGAIAGAVLWSALLRLPGPLARWLCAPYDRPGRLAMAVSMLVSIVFLLVMVIGALIALSLFIGLPTHAEDAKKLRGILFVSSIIGFIVIPTLIRLEGLIHGRRKE